MTQQEGNVDIRLVSTNSYKTIGGIYHFPLLIIISTSSTVSLFSTERVSA